MTRTKGAKVAELHVRELATSADQVLDGWPIPALPRLPLVRGWLPGNQGVVLVLQEEESGGPAGFARSKSCESIWMAVGRRSRKSSMPGRQTVRWLPDRGELLVTRSVLGVPNVFAVALTTGNIRAVTRNADADIAFGGMAALGPGHFVAVHDKRKKDIWMLDASTANRRAHD